MKTIINKWVRFRILLIFSFFLIGFTVLFLRAYNLQVTRHSELVAKAENQRSKSIPLTRKRGFIYDRNSQMLAVSISVDSIYANPKDIKDVSAASRKLSKILNIKRRVIAKKLKNKNVPFVWLKRKASFEESEKIAKADIKGVDFVKESKRYYPNANLASHLLGFAGIDSEGLEGLELKYDYYIKGDQEYLYGEKDALGKIMSLKETTAKWGDGCDLYLTIDKSIQYITESELKKAVEKFSAKSGIAIVQEPATGKILAMATYPDFNPNTFTRTSASVRRNRAITDNFDPGSTFKPFIVAAALEDKAIKDKELFYCENGAYYVDGVKMRDTKKHGWLTPRKIIKYSSNIGTIKIAEKLGKKDTFSYITRFGFGSRSGVDLPGESLGLLRNYKKWRNVDFSTIAFGQGISATALQLVNGFSTLANGGKLMRPYLVEKIVTKDKSIVKEYGPEIRNFAISTETAALVTKYLTEVVKEGGTGTKAAIKNFTVAGKTGTSQKVDHELGQYSTEKFIGSFIGYAPAENPIVTVGVFIDEPEEQRYGGVVAAPAFNNIVSQILNLRGIEPAVNVASVSERKSERRSRRKVKIAKRKGVRYVTARSGSIVMPDLAGMSLRQIIDSFSKSGLDLNITGSGKVVEQIPAPGEIISKGKEVFIRCTSSL